MTHRHVHVRRPATPAELAAMRHILIERLTAAGVPDDDVTIIALSVSEAATNAIEHAYRRVDGLPRPRDGWFEIDADIESESVEVVVRDAGRWRPKEDPHGGRGLSLIGRLMDDFELRRRPFGTEVWMRRSFRGKDWSVSTQRELVRLEFATHRDIPVCDIAGELDASNVDDVLARVLAAISNDQPGVVLDLTTTTYLDSAGVRMLFELARRLRMHRQELRIVVPPEGIVRRVLVLTAIADVIPIDDEIDEAVDALATRA
jgi:anti-anti-sigma factor